MSESVLVAGVAKCLAVRPAAAPVKPFSQRAFDATMCCLAFVAKGLGPFLVIDLTTRRGWSSADAGAALSMMLLGSVLSQTLSGAWSDRTKFKRFAIAAAALVVAASSIALYYATSRAEVFTLQAITGVAVTVFTPAIAALSLGLVGRLRHSRRAGRNEACFHAGNVTAASIAVLASRLWGTEGIFYGVAAMAVASAISSLFIRESDIDHQLARGADGVGDS